MIWAHVAANLVQLGCLIGNVDVRLQLVLALLRLSARDIGLVLR